MPFSLLKCHQDSICDLCPYVVFYSFCMFVLSFDFGHFFKSPCMHIRDLLLSSREIKAMIKNIQIIVHKFKYVLLYRINFLVRFKTEAWKFLYYAYHFNDVTYVHQIKEKIFKILLFFFFSCSDVTSFDVDKSPGQNISNCNQIT